MMIRILHIVSSLNINAGMMSVVMNYYRHINRNEIQFDFLYFYEMKENHKTEIESLGGRTYCFGVPSYFSSYQSKIRRFFEEHRGEYKAIHCHPIWAATIFANVAKKEGVKHIIAHSHSTKYSNKFLSSIRNRIIVSFIDWFATDYIACSPEAAYLFGKQKAENGKVTILKNAIEINKYSYDEKLRNQLRNEFNISEDAFVIGNVGRLCIEKNQKFLLHIFKAYLAKYDETAKLLIVGDGELRESIANEINNLNLNESVIMTGKRTDIKAILSAMDVFVMPSLFEGAPVSAIEAMCNGLPVVLSDTITKSIDSHLTSYCGLKENYIKWVEIINRTQQSMVDRKDCSVLVKMGLEIKNEANKLEKLYKELE